jgi:hypothetical protein
MTLHDALAQYPDDIRWLCDYAQVDLADWDIAMEVTYRTDGVNEVYLGDDGETVFVVHGQAEPQLACDAALWKAYQDDEKWTSGESA